MKVSVSQPDRPADADLLAVGLCEGEELPAELAAARGAADAKGGFKKLTMIHPEQPAAGPRRRPRQARGARRRAAPGRRGAGRQRGRQAGGDLARLAVPESERRRGALAEGLVTGTILGSYRFDRFKSADPDDPAPPRLESLTLLGARRARRGGRGGAHLRRGPEPRPRPAEPALQRRHPVLPRPSAPRRSPPRHDALSVEVLGREEIAAKEMGGLVAVSQGSAEEPQLIVLRYAGGGSGQTLGLVGKGVTFDTGGISLKPAAGMHEMKMDMSGAAAVLEAVGAIAELGLAINLIAVIPSTENMPSGTAIKPGDIITQYNGKTVEVNNTDAEGRLILADALAYAVEQGAERIVDLATLTGAVMIALGSTYAAVISNDDELAGEVERGRRGDRRAGLAPAPPPRVQGADEGHGRRPHQRRGQAQGGDDLPPPPSSRSSSATPPGPTSTSPAPPGTSAATTPATTPAATASACSSSSPARSPPERLSRRGSCRSRCRGRAACRSRRRSGSPRRSPGGGRGRGRSPRRGRGRCRG